MNIDIHVVHCSLPSGPEGIRTPDLLSAIEARSQLRYRPILKAKRILPEAFGNVNVNMEIVLKQLSCKARIKFIIDE